MKLLIVDGNSILFRAYWATAKFNLMRTSKGEYTNAIFGFANMLRGALNKLKPSHCVVALDKAKHNFRHDIFTDYKGNREAAPEPLVPQFALVREYLKSANIPYLEYDEFEADDIIGSLSKHFDVESLILTSDRDMLQLIDDKTQVCRMLKGVQDMKIYDERALYEECQLAPKQIIDLKGLMGDSSDNIPGVTGIGEKGALKLLLKYETCEGVYEHLDELKGKQKENLINGKDDCFLSKELATIKTDIEIENDLDSFLLDVDEASLNDFYDKYEMYSLKGKVTKPRKISKQKCIKVNQISESLLKGFPYLHFDYAGYGYYERPLYGLCIGKDEHAEYISLEDMKRDEALLDFLASSDKPKIVYDIKLIKTLLKRENIEINNLEDLMLFGFLANNHNTSLSKLARYYELNLEESSDLRGTEKKPVVPDEELLLAVCGEIALNGRELLEKARFELKEQKMRDLYYNIEEPLIEVLFDMEQTGIKCDEEALDILGKEFKRKMEEAKEVIYELAGKEINPSSATQLAALLYDDFGLPHSRGSRSTDVEALEKIKDKHPIINYILTYRKYAKLNSTYIEGLKKNIKEDGRIHTIYLQTGTQTGRLSSREPNMQNITVRDREARQVRKAFVAKEGCVLMDCDYSQVELRIIASMAKETKMIEAFKNQIDIHAQTAMDIFDLKPEELTPELRSKAKTINFGITYGMSEYGLAKDANISNYEAKQYIANYYHKYPNIKKFLDAQVAFCREYGFVETLYGRRRYIAEINDDNYMTRERGKREALNAPIQGTAADIMKLAMVACFEAIKQQNLKSKIILQIHDELVFEVPEAEIEIMRKLIKDCMNKVVDLAAGLECSFGYAKNWLEAK